MRKTEFNIVVVGSGGVGKRYDVCLAYITLSVLLGISCFTIQFIASRFLDYYDPTLEDFYVKYCFTIHPDLSIA